MRLIFHKHTYVFLAAALLIVAALFILISTLRSDESHLITATVTKGEVTETVSVSGFIEAKNTAELAFPVTGKVTEVFVDEGSTVEEGEVLATLASNALVAERNEAVAALRIAEAQYDEAVAGPTTEARAVSITTILNAEENLQRVKSEQERLVENARAKLLSDNLEAITTKADERATPPSITGTYTCDAEGTYTLEVYNSGAASGYSYRLSGLEEGGYTAYTDQPAPFGNCGLYIQFTDGDLYGNSTWTVAIPNTRSSSYITNKNAYELAKKQEANAIATAENALTLAKEEATNTNASARTEVVQQRTASIDQARARIARIDANIVDRSIVAPFNGIITDVSVIKGETATAEPVITLLAEDAFELIARIPEIDITKIAVGQTVATVFDARVAETLRGAITYISPLATEIDGVAYFETTIVLDEAPTWIRSGLNADVEIIVRSETDILTLPRRFITEHPDGTFTVTLAQGKKQVAKDIEILFIGNDGYVAITGLAEGDTVVLPQSN